MRLGAVGARPGAFNTVRYSEKILERHGISVTTVDLSEFLGKAGKTQRRRRRPCRRSSTRFAATRRRPACRHEKLMQMARLGVVLSRWMEANALDATAIQCWTSVQQNFGCNVCTLMSMMSERFMPSACEVDVTGVLTMYAMQLAAGSPAAIVDWNNNYGDDDDKCALFHCGNWAKSFLPDIKIATAPILGSTLGVENTYGALGRPHAGRAADVRPRHDGRRGRLHSRVRRRRRADRRRAETFGTRAVAHVPQLQQLLRYICENGFEHHVVMTRSQTAGVLAEALSATISAGTRTNTAGDDRPRTCVSNRFAIAAICSDIIFHAGAGHTGGSLSCVDILNVLYNRVLRVSPETFDDPNRDRYIQSKGHSVEALYVVLADRGFFPQGGARNAVPVSIAVRRPSDAQGAGHRDEHRRAGPRPADLRRHGARRQSWTTRPYRVFTLLGDGELAEGSNWEAAMAAAHYKLDNLTAILDHNTLQITGRTRDVCSNEPIDEKFRAFGWDVRHGRWPRLRATDRRAYGRPPKRASRRASSPTRSRAAA